MPDRVKADDDAALGQLRHQCPQRDIGSFGEPSEKPRVLALERIGSPPAPGAGSRTSRGTEALRPFHNTGNAHIERGRYGTAGSTGGNRRNNPFAQI